MLWVDGLLLSELNVVLFWGNVDHVRDLAFHTELCPFCPQANPRNLYVVLAQNGFLLSFRSLMYGTGVYVKAFFLTAGPVGCRLFHWSVDGQRVSFPRWLKRLDWCTHHGSHRQIWRSISRSVAFMWSSCLQSAHGQMCCRLFGGWLRYWLSIICQMIMGPWWFCHDTRISGLLHFGYQEFFCLFFCFWIDLRILKRAEHEQQNTCWPENEWMSICIWQFWCSYKGVLEMGN